MDRIIAPNSVVLAAADAAPATGTPQYATDGNPTAGIPATIWPAYQYNAIQEELLAIIQAVGTPNRNNNGQVLTSLKVLFGNNISAFANGYIKLGGGLIFQWGTSSTSSIGAVNVVFPLTFPDTAFNVQATVNNTANANSTNAVTLGIGTLGTGGFQLFSNDQNGAVGPIGFYWWAVGN